MAGTVYRVTGYRVTGEKRWGFSTAIKAAWLIVGGFSSCMSGGVSAAAMPFSLHAVNSTPAAMPAQQQDKPQDLQGQGKQAQRVALEQSAASFAALSVPDLAASTRWYQRQFGLTAQFHYQADDHAVAIVVLSAPGLTIELQQHSAAQVPQLPQGKAYLQHGIFKVGIQVQDLQQALRVLQANGTQLEVPAFTDPNGRFHSAIIRDNSGNLLQLFQPIRTKP